MASPGDADAIEQVTTELNAAREEEGALEGDDGTRWAVVTRSCFNVNGGSWYATAELREVEEVRAERLEFLGLALVPSHYDESQRSDNYPLLIEAAVTPSAKDSEALERQITEHALRKDATYFDLLRVGVQGEPLRVRFGRCLWQESKGGTRQHLLVFVGAKGDDKTPPSDPHRTNAARIALQGREIAEAIIDEMALADLLSPEALERIRQRGESAWDKQFRSLYETRDLSLFY